MLYNSDDTIAAISTPPGTGGIGVIRLSGPGSVQITDKFFSPSSGRPLANTDSHKIVHGWITERGTPVDEVLVAIMLKPGSYTGEDVVEISAHAGPVILGRILKLAVDNGARLAGPGEFTYRAFLNGKLDLVKAEAVADMISSRTSAALEAALMHLKGSFSSKIAGFREQLVQLLGTFEAALDHAEEDIEFITKSDALKTIADLRNEISSIINASKKARFLKEGIRTAIIGRPNAGKSSLLNAILQRERSIVTDIPGTTRDVIEETVEIDGFPVLLMDTAGLRAHSQDPVEKIGQNKALDAVKSANVVLWVIDSSASDLAADRHICAILSGCVKEKIIIPLFNKIDLPANISEKELTSILPPNAGQVLKLSTKTGFGVSGLKKRWSRPSRFLAALFLKLAA